MYLSIFEYSCHLFISDHEFDHNSDKFPIKEFNKEINDTDCKSVGATTIEL